MDPEARSRQQQYLDQLFGITRLERDVINGYLLTNNIEQVDDYPIKIITKKDDNTCNGCLAMHGNLYSASDFPLPHHPHCRCFGIIQGGPLDGFLVGTAQPVKEKQDTYKTSFLDGLHFLLDLVGFVPVVGEIADGINSLIYLAEKDYINAALSATAMIPFLGWAAGGTKIVRTGIKVEKVIDAADDAKDAAKAVDQRPSGVKPPNNTITDLMGKNQNFYKHSTNSYDCSEIAYDFYKAADQQGIIYEILPKSGGLNVKEYGVIEVSDYHTVFSDGTYIYDPRYSNTPVVEEEYFKMIESLNPNGIKIAQ